jgi:hypothetical protein
MSYDKRTHPAEEEWKRNLTVSPAKWSMTLYVRVDGMRAYVKVRVTSILVSTWIGRYPDLHAIQQIITQG